MFTLGFVGQVSCTLRKWSLGWAPGYAVVPIVRGLQVIEAVGGFPEEEIVCISEIAETGERADLGWDFSGQLVPGHVELPQAHHLGHGLG